MTPPSSRAANFLDVFDADHGEPLAQLRQHILPEVERVPAMVAALCRAQEERVAYMHVG